MPHIAFVSCNDLTPYFPSKKNPFFTHDDQVAADFLISKGYQVSPLIWGTPITEILASNFDLVIIRSPWDYMSSEQRYTLFMNWLQQLALSNIPVQNPVPIMQWNLDKHYLKDLQRVTVPIVPTRFIPPKEALDVVKTWSQMGDFVLKPSISAAAHDTYLITSTKKASEFNPYFEHIRQNRCFMLQPFLSSVTKTGEWSLIFINHTYSHSILKKPKKGHWLVQDEQGGSVHWQHPTSEVLTVGKHAFNHILPAYHKKTTPSTSTNDHSLLYARVDILESEQGPLISEIELIEPELFFLDRRTKTYQPYVKSLELFHHGIKKSLHD